MLHHRNTPAFDLQSCGRNSAAFRCRLIETGARADNDVWPSLAIDPREERETFGRDLGIGEYIFDRGEVGFRQEAHAWKPTQNRFGKGILRAYAGARNPNVCSIAILAMIIGGTPMPRPRDDGAEKCLGRFNDVRKFYRCALRSNLFELASDRSALRYALEQLAGSRSFHDEPSSKVSERSKVIA